MGNAKAKSINLLLYEGDLNGVISIEDTSWNSGELYSAPRQSIGELIATGACNKYGVYLLLSQDMVYIGQSSDLAKRITQHTVGKDWWESVVILTTKDDSLNHSDIDYLESVLIEKAFSFNRLDCDNKNKGNPPKVDKFRKVYLGQYLDEALFLMQLIGINVFCADKSATKKQLPGTLINTIDTSTRLALGKRAKAEAIEFLNSQNVSLSKNVSYAALQQKRPEFWLNPKRDVVNKEWSIILNDTGKLELIVLKIPAGMISIASNEAKGLFCRNDRPDMIDLNISISNFTDRRSAISFEPYLIKRIPYGNTN